MIEIEQEKKEMAKRIDTSDLLPGMSGNTLEEVNQQYSAYQEAQAAETAAQDAERAADLTAQMERKAAAVSVDFNMDIWNASKRAERDDRLLALQMQYEAERQKIINEYAQVNGLDDLPEQDPWRAVAQGLQKK